MSYAEFHEVIVTTASDGSATFYLPDGTKQGSLTGRVLNVIYTKHGTTPFADGVDFTITAEKTGENIWVEENVNSSKVVAPSQPIHDQVGVAQVTRDYIVLVNDRIKIVIANGGASKIGTFKVKVG